MIKHTEEFKREAVRIALAYPHTPRPSYTDQVISLLRDHAIEPRIAHEACELQIAIGLVAAEEGVAIVPESVRRSRTEDVVYRGSRRTRDIPDHHEPQGGRPFSSASHHGRGDHAQLSDIGL